MSKSTAFLTPALAAEREMAKQTKHILVTGGAGFVGSHLVDRLVEAGHEVTVLDNLYTGSRSNLSHLKGNQVVRFVEASVVDAFDMDVDEIYNLACPASPVHYQADPIYTMKTSVFGALNALELARKNKCRIFQASTSEVYGDPDVHPQPESYWGKVNPVGIRSCYDEGKRVAETLFFDYHRVHGLDIKVARIFNTYGPRMHPEDGRVVSNFIVQALKGQDLTIYGEGQQTRSFCYVDDLVEGFLKLMASSSGVTGPVNLGNPGEFTVRELAELVLGLTGSKSKMRFLPLPSDDPMRRKPDIAKAHAELGWSPQVNIQQGLEKTIAYFDQHLSSAN
jgi:UDP-glucuronate decarboxylase